MSTEKKMHETFDRIEDIFSQMKLLYDTAKETDKARDKQQEIWERLIKEQTDNNKERLEIIEKRWSSLMKIVIVLTGLFLASFVNSTIALNNRPTETEIDKKIIDVDAASKSDVMRGAEALIEDIYGTISRETGMTHEEAYIERENAKMNANRKITDYNPRSIQNTK